MSRALTGHKAVGRVSIGEDPVLLHPKNAARDPGVVLVVFAAEQVAHAEVVYHELHDLRRHLRNMREGGEKRYSGWLKNRVKGERGDGRGSQS